ncbi:flagellar hook assembly protein FlgD [Cellvibrio japonicus]|uniref:Basal-body rod modification protein FlgD n=1 Tax=Cellvibrio japonicus (strain Ueda107) TaxID=498211 RepID=B3PGS6_CELJU|nr:flagellar hook assembly protein FlgD [Cellvibrio japonicus]ACE85766.1 flagellar basal-body rod modification protein FlgD [Cellvibrio japonicus Ueda107]QEI12421.1 flagellar hook assembly protein FlgD [Cellvibrio japonicus]QEI15994.1 flagellar hook assembly protein FlgD [Cellvibrio japonicus]QEI19573.1 flagellar hook assembly protein FlgD [Cellvibrio japonicus]
MTTVTGNSSVVDNLSITKRQETKRNSNELGQAAFLELMIAQMNNQNPLSPQDNTEFVAQLAQFSSVEGLERLNKSFNSFMSNNALQASSLVGRSVSVESDKSTLYSGGIVAGSVTLDYATTDTQMRIYDANGALVQTIPVGELPSGESVFRWDGQNIEINGNLLDWEAGDDAAAAGQYRFEVTATQNGKSEAIATSLSANVNSVTIGDNGELILNLAGIGAVEASKVKQFN